MTDVLGTLVEDRPVAGESVPQKERTRRVITEVPSRANRRVNQVTMGAGISVLVLLTLVDAFRLIQSNDALGETGV
jgi:hypothetical protein